MKTAIKKTADTKSKMGTAAAKPTASKTAPKGTVTAKPSAAEGLRELFVDSLKDIYWAEKALVGKVLQSMVV
ncbi:hypothetical protein [Flavobacterium salmonis]|uniref:Uncharacterized protein n=1 Tax=Flavobacterium salmonis TaxID=2654844 RepID=A0A6V6Z4S5_9FLAO|nr:hypothetical protein [Flavobacterium salmonis]CAD0006434.1 hypothetical protein FLAT13_03330 [Flavobacterium salmonis]